MATVGRKRALLTAPAPEHAPAVERKEEKRLALWKDSLYEHIARRLLNHHPLKSIASAVGLSINEVRTIMRKDDFRVKYVEVKNKLFKSIDEAMYDQRRDIMERAKAGMPRVLSELFLQVEQGHGTGGVRVSERARTEAAKYLAGMCGYAPIEKRIQLDVPVPKIEDAQLDFIAKSIAAARSKGEVVDVKVVDGD